MTTGLRTNNPASASHQHGQRGTIRASFALFDEATESQNWALFPALYREVAKEFHRH